MTQSRYTYDNTDILINKMNILDQSKLDEYEAVWSYLRISELYEKPIPGKFDLKHLCKIHEYIFQDLYPTKSEMKKIGLSNKLSLRGELRNENIAKGHFQFAGALYLENGANHLFEELKKDNYLMGISHDIFIQKLAYYLSEINVLHVFREGNGRSTREWGRILALKCGYELDWSIVDKDIILNAFIRSVKDTADLEMVLKKSITPLHN